jgi:cysteine desulfurase/selenocysteine lyase
MFDVDTIRQDFPVLQQQVDGKPLVYLDSGASSQKPLPVIQAMDECYRTYYANVHRGIYQLSEKTSASYEEARKKVARFINAKSWREVIFTRNATESINLVAYTWGRQNIKAGDTVLVTEMPTWSPGSNWPPRRAPVCPISPLIRAGIATWPSSTG